MTALALGAIVVLIAVTATVVAVIAANFELSDPDRPSLDRTTRAGRLVVGACTLGIGMLAASTAGGGSNPAWWGPFAVLVGAVLGQVVLGELVPAALGRTRPGRVLAVVGDPVRSLTESISGAVHRMDLVGAALARRIGPGDGSVQREVTEVTRTRDELRHVVRHSRMDGSLSGADADLLDRALRLAGKSAADAFTPRVAVRFVSAEASVADLVRICSDSGLSRFPVCGEGLDDVLGVVHVKDVLGRDRAEWDSTPVAELMRPVLAVPESKELSSLMVELQDEAGQFAVVVDEYGGTAGIVTLEDLIEEVVGEIDDEHDPARTAPSVRRWAGAHLVSGRIHPDELVDAVGLRLPEGGYETLGGFVMDRLGRVPEAGDRLERGGWDLEVLEMDGRRVDTVRLTRLAPAVHPEPESS